VVTAANKATISRKSEFYEIYVNCNAHNSFVNCVHSSAVCSLPLPSPYCAT